MTKFGWLVVLGIVMVLGGIGATVYVLLQQTPEAPVSDPYQQIEVVLPPQESPIELDADVSATTTTATSSAQ